MFFTKRVNTERIMQYLSDVLFRPIVLQGGTCFGYYMHDYDLIGSGSSAVTQEENCISLINTQTNGTGNNYFLIGPYDLTMYDRVRVVMKYEQAGDSGRMVYGFTPSIDVSGMSAGQHIADQISGAFEAGDPKTAGYGPWSSSIDLSAKTGLYYFFVEVINTTASGPDINKAKIYSVHLEV